MGRPRLLVVDEEPSSAIQVQRLLGDRAADVTSSPTGVDALRVALEASAGGSSYDVVLLDYLTPNLDSMDVLRKLGEVSNDSRVIVMAENDAEKVALQAMRLGAFDFIAKPLNSAELRLRVERALRDAVFDKDPSSVTGVRRPRKDDVIIGGGEWTKSLYEKMSMVAPTDVTVAIYGESGTGKELVARTIHNLSHRYKKPFVVVNCAAIPDALLEDELFGHVRGAFTDANRDREGLFAAADGGTLFLDEIGEMPLGLQVKILRVLQSQEFRRIGADKDSQVDVRVVTATNRKLEEAVASGEFREDLFYRINVFPVSLPPLRERPSDIPLLAHHFLLKHRAKVGKGIEGFSPEALVKLGQYSYPGNVRELENKIHHAMVVAQGELISPNDIQLEGGPTLARSTVDINRPFRELKREVVDSFESRYVKQIIAAHHGNVAAAARHAGMDRKNLWSLAKKHGVDLENLRRSNQVSRR